MKKNLTYIISTLIAGVIVFGILSIFLPLWVCAFLYILFIPMQIIAYLLNEYITIKNIKKLLKRIAIWVKYKRVKELNYSCDGCVFLSKRRTCMRFNNADYCFDNECIFIKRSFNPLKWLKKLFFICIITIFFSSCCTYQNCSNYKPDIEQSDTTNVYWF